MHKSANVDIYVEISPPATQRGPRRHHTPSPPFDLSINGRIHHRRLFRRRPIAQAAVGPPRSSLPSTPQNPYVSVDDANPMFDDEGMEEDEDADGNGMDGAARSSLPSTPPNPYASVDNANPWFDDEGMEEDEYADGNGIDGDAW